VKHSKRQGIAFSKESISEIKGGLKLKMKKHLYFFSAVLLAGILILLIHRIDFM